MKRLILIFLLSVATVIGFVTFAHAQNYGSAFTIEYETDRQGGDIQAGYPADRFGQCMDDCANSPQCRAFTWVQVNEQPPNYDNSSPLCWLKDTVPGRRWNPGMISGVKQ